MTLTEQQIVELLANAAPASPADAAAYSEMDLDPAASLKCAAVLIPLVWHEDAWHILYTRRTQQVESHKGQVSFPGGGCDAGETTPQQTALREAHEEIGVYPGDVRVLGLLPSMVTITSFRVTPVVGVLRWPAVFKLNEVEVERVFTIPVEWLANAKNRWALPFPGSNRKVIIYHPYDGEVLWGATARMTVDFLKLIGA